MEAGHHTIPDSPWFSGYTKGMRAIRSGLIYCRWRGRDGTSWERTSNFAILHLRAVHGDAIQNKHRANKNNRRKIVWLTWHKCLVITRMRECENTMFRIFAFSHFVSCVSSHSTEYPTIRSTILTYYWRREVVYARRPTRICFLSGLPLMPLIRL